ncbi:MAG: RidA family protein [Candidatus Binatus sp.]|nr:RidA family protein [Candidatus Binatus sp.]
MSAITRISSNAPWEPIAGYSRLVRAGDIVAVSGTTATDERGLIVGAGQMYVQARQAIGNIRAALERAGLLLENVIRTRMFVTDIGRFAEAARAHKEFFGDFPPASTMVEVRRLVNPDMLIEIEADAYAGAAEKERSDQAPSSSVPVESKKAAPAAKSKGIAAAKKSAKKKPAPKKSIRKK